MTEYEIEQGPRHTNIVIHGREVAELADHYLGKVAIWKRRLPYSIKLSLGQNPGRPWELWFVYGVRETVHPFWRVLFGYEEPTEIIQ